MEDSVDEMVLVVSRLAKRLRPSEPIWFLDELDVDGAGDGGRECSLCGRDSADEAVLRRAVWTGVMSAFSWSSYSLEEAEDRLDLLAKDDAFPGEPKGVCIGDASCERDANEAIKLVA